MKFNPHTTFVVEVEGVIDVHNASLTSQKYTTLCANNNHDNNNHDNNNNKNNNEI